MDETGNWFNTIAIWGNLIACILCAIQFLVCRLHERPKQDHCEKCPVPCNPETPGENRDQEQ